MERNQAVAENIMHIAGRVMRDGEYDIERVQSTAPHPEIMTDSLEIAGAMGFTCENSGMSATMLPVCLAARELGVWAASKALAAVNRAWHLSQAVAGPAGEEGMRAAAEALADAIVEMEAERTEMLEAMAADGRWLSALMPDVEVESTMRVLASMDDDGEWLEMRLHALRRCRDHTTQRAQGQRSAREKASSAVRADVPSENTRTQPASVLTTARSARMR